MNILPYFSATNIWVGKIELKVCKNDLLELEKIGSEKDLEAMSAIEFIFPWMCKVCRGEDLCLLGCWLRHRSSPLCRLHIDPQKSTWNLCRNSSEYYVEVSGEIYDTAI